MERSTSGFTLRDQKSDPIYYYFLLWEVCTLLYLSPSLLSKPLQKVLGKNHFAEPNQHVFSFLGSIPIWRMTH
jgi:hypothetical protein